MAKEFNCCTAAIYFVLQKLKITLKKRSKFIEKLSKINPKKLTYVDEAGFDSYFYRERARALRGLKIKGFVSGKRYKRIGIVAGKCGKKILAPMQYSGTMDCEIFEYWMENMLLKNVEKGSVIVLDNAAFHRKKELEMLAKQASCEILFLPPYSPDLNPIEQFWSWIKRKLRESLHKFDSLDAALLDCFQLI